MEIDTTNNRMFGKIDHFYHQQTTEDIKTKTDRFEQFLNTKEIDKNERTKTLEQWINSLEELKDRLEDETTKDNLNLYKGSLKKFLDYYSDNDLYLKDVKTKDGIFRSKNIQIIESVDDKINGLTEDLINSQMGNLEILRLTGEIQGLLFQLDL